jgi:hypothetical protein
VAVIQQVRKQSERLLIYSSYAKLLARRIGKEPLFYRKYATVSETHDKSLV